jgi:dienelactone hydrolase
MEMTRNFLLTGSAGRAMVTDVFYKKDDRQKPVVIYAHGFNGFKDWGNFDLIAQQFALAGFVFIKFNFSHNGTTPDQPEDFADLDAYAENNYSKELFDLQEVIDWALDKTNPHRTDIDPGSLYLIGHSRGGGIVILKASEDQRVKGIATWASVSECKTPWSNWSEEKMNEWKETNVQYYSNARTKQQMPLHYQLHEDYTNNAAKLDIKTAMTKLRIPVLICHGLNDEVVPIEKAYQLKEALPGAELFLVESDHVFGRKHPWADPALPLPMQQVVNRTMAFFQVL